MKRLISLVVSALALTVVACATPKGPLVPYAQTAGYRAIGTSVYGYLEKDLDGDGLPDVVLVRQDSQGGYRLQVMQRRDPAGGNWSKTCDTDPVKGEDMHQVTWLGNASKRQLVMLVVGEENPEELIQHFVVMNPDGCNVEWTDTLTTPRRDTPVIRSPAMPPEGLSVAADGNVLRLVDHTELVGLQGQAGPVGLLARYRERLGVVQDGHMTVAEKTQAVLRKRDVKVNWEVKASAPSAANPNVVGDAVDPNAAAEPMNSNVVVDAGAQGLKAVAELSDGQDATALRVPAGVAGRLTIDSDESFVLLELHHGCDEGEDQGLVLVHSGRAYTTGTAPTDHAPFRAAGRRHPREKTYTQELLALHDALHTIWLDVPESDSVRCLREIAVYGWQ